MLATCYNERDPEKTSFLKINKFLKKEISHFNYVYMSTCTCACMQVPSEARDDIRNFRDSYELPDIGARNWSSQEQQAPLTTDASLSLAPSSIYVSGPHFPRRQETPEPRFSHRSPEGSTFKAVHTASQILRRSYKQWDF